MEIYGYSTSWENLSQLKKWLQPVENNKSKAFCVYCKCEIAAKLTLLLKHALSVKHRNRMASSNRSSNNPSRIKSPSKRQDLAHCELAQFFSEYKGMTSEHPSKNLTTNQATARHDNGAILQDFDIISKVASTEDMELNNIQSKSLVKNIANEVKSGTMILHDNKMYQQISNTQTTSEPSSITDEISSYSNYVSAELHSIKHNYSRQLAKHKINSILYDASTGVYDL